MNILNFSHNVKPLVFSAPDFKEFHEIPIREDNTRRVVAGMETDTLSGLKVLVKEKLHSVSIREMLFGKILCFRIMNQTKRRY